MLAYMLSLSEAEAKVCAHKDAPGPGIGNKTPLLRWSKGLCIVPRMLPGGNIHCLTKTVFLVESVDPEDRIQPEIYVNRSSAFLFLLAICLSPDLPSGACCPSHRQWQI